jgi:hypothetical protein
MPTIVESPAPTTAKRCYPESEICKIEYHHTKITGTRTFWCQEHQRWVYDFPVRETFTYRDGSEYTQEIK